MTGLGTHHHKIATTSAEAQRLFNQGLVLFYGFNHGQAIRLFQRAAELDPLAPMPLWGIALAHGPNINDFEMDRERARTADEYAKKALALTSPANPRERAYAEALSKRYSSDPNADHNHNVHFESYAAAMAGQFARAKRTAGKLTANVAPFIAEMPMIEAFIPQQYYVLLRFSKWDDIMALPAPAASLQLTSVMWRYARGVARAGKGDVAGARTEQQAFADLAGRIPAETPVGVLNTAAQMFAVARAVLEGRIAAAGGDKARAIEQYRIAVAAEDLLAYDEPPTWYYPVRETLGAVLLGNGDAPGAEQVFRDDLKYNPRNGRSLFGLWKALEAQGRRTDAARAGAEFRRVWSVADVPLRIEDL